MSLAVQSFDLDLLPGKHPKHVKATRFDKGADGWAFQANIKYDGYDYEIPDGYTATVEGSIEKYGGAFKTAATINTFNGKTVVAFDVDDGAATFDGAWWCKIVFKKGASSISTAAFIMDVDRPGFLAGKIAAKEEYREIVTEIVTDWLDEHGAIDELNKLTGKNLVQSYSAADPGSTTRRNVLCDGEKAVILYRENEIVDGVDYTSPFFRINLSSTLVGGKEYVFSCNVSGVGSLNIPRYNLTDSEPLDVSSPISSPFELHDGKLTVKFTPAYDVENFVRFREVSGAVHETFGTHIEISNIQIESGESATVFQPSVEAAFEEAKLARDLTHTYIERATEEGWATAMFEGVHLMATTPLVVDNLHLLTEAEKESVFVTAPERLPNFNVSEEVYVPYPFPNRYTFLFGCTDRGFMQLCNVNGIGARAPIAARFRLETPYYRAGTDLQKVTLRLFTSDRRHSIPRSPEYGYNADIASEIVAIARSYVAAQEAGRRFVYGGNIMYTETANKPRTMDGRITTADGYAIMECDTFVGMVLRGIDYEHSPYNPDYAFPNAENGWVFTPPDPSLPSGWVQNNDGSWTYHEPQVGTWTRSGEQNPSGSDPNREKNKRIIGTDGRTGYEQLMLDTSANLPIWAQKIRERITSDVAHKCYGRDMKFACDYAWMSFSISSEVESNGNTKTIGCVFTDPREAMPGDICFYRKPDVTRWFDNISHCCVVVDNDNENGNVTIAEVTGRSDSGGRVLHTVKVNDRPGGIAYFARPYGWYDSEENE